MFAAWISLFLPIMYIEVNACFFLGLMNFQCFPIFFKHPYISKSFNIGMLNNFKYHKVASSTKSKFRNTFFFKTTSKLPFSKKRYVLLRRLKVVILSFSDIYFSISLSPADSSKVLPLQNRHF